MTTLNINIDLFFSQDYTRKNEKEHPHPFSLLHFRPFGTILCINLLYIDEGERKTACHNLLLSFVVQRHKIRTCWPNGKPICCRFNRPGASLSGLRAISRREAIARNTFSVILTRQISSYCCSALTS